MFAGKSVAVVIPAAGKGKRMGSSQSKQFIELMGKPILVHTLDRFQMLDEIDHIAVAADRKHITAIKSWIRDFQCTKVTSVINGGNERQDSVWNCLMELKSVGPDIVLIHDAVRPFVSGRIIRSVLQAVVEHSAAVPAVRLKDTIVETADGHFISRTIDREKLFAVQTPQGFRFSLICEAFEDAIRNGYYGTDDASLIERIGEKVRIIEGSYDNIKITTPEDLELAAVYYSRSVLDNS